MEDNTEIKEALAELNRLANDKVDSLENEIKPQIKSIREEMTATIRAFDKFQINNKNTGGHFKEDTSIKGQISKALLEHTDDLAKLRNRDIKSFGFSLKAVQDLNFAGNYTGAGVTTSSSPIGIVGIPHRLRHVRDLLRQTTMTGASLPVLKDNGPGEGNPAPVLAGAEKPQMDYDLAEISAPAITIAGIVRFQKAFLDDIPAARAWLTNKMIESYMSVEDSQLLNGTGVAPELGGINLAGNFTAATSLAAANDVAQLVLGILQLRSLEREPSAIVIHPTNYGTILLNQSAGSGEFDLPSTVTVSATGGISILGVPVIDTVAQTLNQYNIIDNNGSLMAFRQGITVEFFEQDRDNVIFNKITARIEARVAFPIYGATYVIKGTFA